VSIDDGVSYLVHTPAVGIPVLLIAVLIVIAIIRNGSGTYQSNVIRRGGAALDRNRSADAKARVRARDPAFDAAAFCRRVGAGFTKLQDAWSRQDLQTVRPFISDGVHERFSLQFAEQRAEGYRNIMRDVAIVDIAIADGVSDEIYDSLDVRIRAQAIDYRVSIADGRRISGSTTTGAFTEIWSFLRRRGASTIAGKPGLIEGHCPNCGAPVELNESANCSRCSALLRSGEYDWVLTEITQECEWQPGAQSHVPGLRQMRAGDAGLSVQAIEDRASVIFWRWIAAQRIGKPDPLQKVSSPAYGEAFATKLRQTQGLGRSYFGACAVGSVGVVGFLPGGGGDGSRDLGLIEVRWSGRRIEAGQNASTKAAGSHHRTLLVLGRQSGSKTDVAKGISSAHCPNCGAPESGGASGSCEFCGTCLNDGNHGWVLDNALSFTDAHALELLHQLRGSTSGAEAPSAEVTAHSSRSRNGAAMPRATATPGLLAWAVKVALADGDLDAREQRVLTRMAQTSSISPGQLGQLIDSARAGTITAPMPLDAEEARQWLGAMAATAAADGRIDAAEYRVLRSLGDRIGMSDHDVRMLLRRAQADQYAEAVTAIREAKARSRGG
jgi:uncharacterized tellurite resistance protein B-like protein